MSLSDQFIVYSSAHVLAYYCVGDITYSRNLIGLINTSILSLFSLYSFYLVATHGLYTPAFLLVQPENVALNNSIVGHFATDLVLGSLLDSKNMELVSGYLHHSAYIGILWYLQQTRQSNLIYLCLPYEIPTVFLNLNRFDRQKRFTLIFGITFAIFRLLYNLYVMAALSPNPMHLSITSLMLLVHLHWYRIWLVKQINRGTAVAVTDAVVAVVADL